VYIVVAATEGSRTLQVRLAERGEGRRWGWFDVYRIYCNLLYVYPVTRKRDGPFRAGRVLQPQNSKLDHGGQCRALLVSTAKAKERTVYFVTKCLGKLWEKDRREMVSSWRTTSVCHFAPLFYLAHCTQTPYSRHKLLETKFTHHTHVHAHTHGDYSHSLRSQTRYQNSNEVHASRIGWVITVLFCSCDDTALKGRAHLQPSTTVPEQ
jgi:hypothetical protein